MELAGGREYGRDAALFSIRPMIFVAGAETLERVIVAQEPRLHALRDGGLPSVILAEPIRGTALTPCRGFRLDAMDSLPGVATEVSLDGLLVLSAFENLCKRHRTDPELRPPVALQPGERSSGSVR